MTTIRLVVLVTVACCAISCSRHDGHRRHIVELIDTSASILPEAASDAISASEQMAMQLKRGDRLTVIPILADASQAEGRIIRLDVPRKRAAYDYDIVQAAATIRKRLEVLRESVLNNPSQQTDILGTVVLASQEFASDRSQRTEKVLVLLTDLIQDDGTANFSHDPKLRSDATAVQTANTVARQMHADLQHVEGYVGLLRSRDYATLNPQRRKALCVFWQALLANYGTRVAITSDGPGLLQQFLQQQVEQAESTEQFR